MAVRDRAHDRADCQTVEIVIHKNQNTKPHRCQKRTPLRFDLRPRPFSIRRRAAGFRHQHDNHAKQDIEDQNVDVHAVP